MAREEKMKIDRQVDEQAKTNINKHGQVREDEVNTGKKKLNN